MSTSVQWLTTSEDMRKYFYAQLLSSFIDKDTPEADYDEQAQKAYDAASTAVVVYKENSGIDPTPSS